MNAVTTGKNSVESRECSKNRTSPTPTRMVDVAIRVSALSNQWSSIGCLTTGNRRLLGRQRVSQNREAIRLGPHRRLRATRLGDLRAHRFGALEPVIRLRPPCALSRQRCSRGRPHQEPLATDGLNFGLALRSRAHSLLVHKPEAKKPPLSAAEGDQEREGR